MDNGGCESGSKMEEERVKGLWMEKTGRQIRANGDQKKQRMKAIIFHYLLHNMIEK